FQRHRDRGLDVASARRWPLLARPELRAGRAGGIAATPEAAQNLAQEIVAGKTFGAAAPAAGRPAEVPRAAAGAAEGARIEAFDALEARLAVRADLAAVELAALVLVADDLVGGVGLVELLVGLGVRGVLVGVVLLGELAESLLDLRVARVPADSEHLVGVTH